ncbi:hypothetical protein QTP70_024942 [Hemibagrus guttatus]|uniref:OCA domain-containing protein n=1 Tax=Hemibagrus guttatus TaxID=175788 RepID=A0AAE0QTC0_9TELE|nr:hypothetical protein QTP70_024942 [Hemibagrus guttatus]
MEAEYSKRVYQGVRVKHTVKDLLAEKRLRQTGGPRFTRDSWEQAGMEPAEGLCGNALAPATVEPSSPSHYRSSSRSSNMGSSQFYSLHTLDDVPYHSSFQLPSSFPCPTYSEHVAKLPVLSTEDTENASSALNDMLPWVKEDATGAWSHCDIRRTF